MGSTKPMRIIAFTGWGQPRDALSPLIPEGADVQHIHYQHFEGYKEFLPFLGGRKCDIVLGWSLGGQIALRALADGRIKAEMLVLLATPFEFLASAVNPTGMDIDSFNQFERDFYQNPTKTQRKFTLLMNKGDSKASILNKEAVASLPSPENWLIWLRELKHFSAADWELPSLPKTLIIQGVMDNIVNVEQANMLHKHIPGSTVTLLEDAGHMLHKHAPLMLSQCILSEYRSLADPRYV